MKSIKKKCGVARKIAKSSVKPAAKPSKPKDREVRPRSTCKRSARRASTKSYLVTLNDYLSLTPVKMFAREADAVKLAEKLSLGTVERLSEELSKRLQLAQACRVAEVSIVEFIDGVPMTRRQIGRLLPR